MESLTDVSKMPSQGTDGVRMDSSAYGVVEGGRVHVPSTLVTERGNGTVEAR